jgi:hypothetical protein
VRVPGLTGGSGSGGATTGGRGAAARALRVLTVLVVVAAPISLGVAPSALAAGTGSIAGTVTEFSAPHNAIEGIEVCVSPMNLEDFSGETFKCEKTNPAGDYTIAGLPSGEYRVQFFTPYGGSLNYVTQYFNGKSSFQEASTVFVTAGVTTPNINAELKEGGRISGTVTDVSTHAAIKGIEVCAFAESVGTYKCTATEPNGEYLIAGLPEGAYEVEFSSPLSFFEPGLDYVTQYWDGKSLASEANTVAVTVGGTASGIDAQLKEGGHIAGKVTSASTGAAIEGAFVCAGSGNGEIPLGMCALTNSNGEYTISALESGSYTVEFEAGKSYVVQYYNNKSSSAEAELVAVTAPGTRSGIDAAMQLVSTPPANTTPPVVSGTLAPGGTLLCAPGLWTGTPAPTFSYQWLRSGAPIAGANATSYAVQSADAGNSISCQVTAKNSKGEKSATSAGVVIPALPGIPPAPTVLPSPTRPVVTITGSKVVVSGKSATVQIQCADAACAGMAELSLQIAVKHRKGKKTVARKETLVLAKGSYSLAVGKSGTLVLRLTAAGKTRLAHVMHHPLAAELSVSVKSAKTTVKSVWVS